MIRGLSAADERFLAALEQIENRAARAEREISSGRKLNTASDAPDSVGPVLSARAQLERTLQIETNLSQAKSETDTAEQAISNAVDILQQVDQLGVQGATETQTPEQRRTLAGQVGAYLQQLVAIANTASGGRYLFSGDTDQVAPYTIDAGGNVGVYAGSVSTREALHPNGTTFAIARGAQEIFEAPGASVFAAVSALKSALENGPAVPEGDAQYNSQYRAQTSAITAALDALSTASVQLNQQLAFYGAVQNRVSGAVDDAQTLEVNLRSQLSSLQDADITTAAIELTQANTQRDAAFSARAKVPTQTLYDYLA
jgi:flagellar hook-associated protein 3 FlgL